MNLFLSKTDGKKDPIWYIVAIIVILLIRFALIGVNIHNNVPPSLPQDPLQYKILAINLYEHSRFTLDVSNPNNHDLLRTPLYPLFLGLFIKLDHSGYLVAFVQQIISLLTTYFIYLLIYHLTRRKNVAALLSLVFFAWPYDIVWSRMTMSEPLFIFLLVTSLYLLITRQDQKSDIVAGLLTGGMLLTRVQGLLFIPLIFLFVLFQGPKRRMWLYPLIVLLCISPWLYRNYQLTHHITLSSSGELNILYGGIVGQDALDKIWALDSEKSKTAFDPYSNESTKDWWSYTTEGYEPMRELISNADASKIDMVYKNVMCSHRIWSLDQLRLLFYRFPPSIQTVFSTLYIIFLLIAFSIITFGFYTTIRKRDKNSLILFILTIGSIIIGTLANMCTAYGRMNIPLIPFLLIAVGLGINAILEARNKI